MYNLLKAELCSYWGGDRDIANAAWASTKDVDKILAKSDDDVRRVVSNIVAQDHGTPKERVFFEFYLEMPLYSERQFDKYRCSLQIQDIQIDYLIATPDLRVGVTQNELSGRYRTIPERAYGVPPDVCGILDKDDLICVADSFEKMLRDQYEAYEQNLKRLKDAEKNGFITNAEYKRAREVLRGILGTSYITNMRVVLNLHSFEHVINQRLSPHAQLESRIIAYRMLTAVREAAIVPVAIEAMVAENGWDVWCKEIEKLLHGAAS